MDEKRVDMIVSLLEGRLAKRTPARKITGIRVIDPEARGLSLDTQTREWHRKMIRCIHCRRGGATQAILDQACLGMNGVDQLDDVSLVALHQAMLRADECIRDGISFADAGLISPTLY